MTALLEIDDVGHTYPTVHTPTLSHISLTIRPGSMTAVLGASGCGKSTLLRIVAGLLRESEGAIRVDGCDLAGVPPERRGVGLLFQKPYLFPHLTVLDNVAYPHRVRGLDRAGSRAAASRMLGLVGLASVVDRHPRQLSGGQEQRVALARALTAKPSVLLLDEPFSALDTQTRNSMLELLVQMRAVLAPTILMVTHDLGEATVADQVAIPVGGQLVQTGPPRDLYLKPADTSVAQLVGGFSELPHRRDGIDLLLTPLGPARVGGSGVECPVGVVTMVRQESVQAIACGESGAIAMATVESVRWGGTRQILTVSLDLPGWPSMTMRAESAPRADFRIGDRVGVRRVGPILVVAAGSNSSPIAPASRQLGDDSDLAGERAVNRAAIGDLQ
ncbi:MAG: ABC transporter ATP-binding protein [Actinomycetales bacterium]